MQTKNALGSLIHRYQSILKKCKELNIISSLILTSTILINSPEYAFAKYIDIKDKYELKNETISVNYDNTQDPYYWLSDGFIQVSNQLSGSGTLQADNYIYFYDNNSGIQDQTWTGEITINAGLGPKVHNHAIHFNQNLNVEKGKTILNAYKGNILFERNLIAKNNANIILNAQYGHIYLGYPNISSNNIFTLIEDGATAIINSQKGNIFFHNSLTGKNNATILINAQKSILFSKNLTIDNNTNTNIISLESFIDFRKNITINNKSNLVIKAKENIYFYDKLNINNNSNVIIETNGTNYFDKDITIDNGSTLILNGKTQLAHNIEIKNSNPINQKSFTSVIVEDYTQPVHGTVVTVGNNTSTTNNKSALKIKKGLHSGGNFTTKANGYIILGDKFTINNYSKSHSMDIKSTLFDANKYLNQNVEGLNNNSTKDYYQSAVFISNSIKLDKTTINVIGSSTNSQKSGLYVAKKNLLVADFSNINVNNATTNTNFLIDNTNNKSVTFEHGSGLHLTNLKATTGNEYYTIIKGGVTNFQQAIDQNNDGKIDADSGIYVSGNALFDYDVTVKDNNLIAVVNFNKNNGITNLMDPSLARVITNHYQNNGKDTNPLISSALNNTAMSRPEKALSIESAAKIATISGALQQTMKVATTSNEYVLNRASFSPHFSNIKTFADNKEYNNLSAGDFSKNKINLWAMPMFFHEKTEDLKSCYYKTGYRSNFNGIVLGADHTWENSFRLGIMTNMGTGSSKSIGSFEKTETNYNSLGFGLYSAYLFNNIGLIADINYTNIYNEVKQYNTISLLTSNFDSHAISAGLKTEYSYQLFNKINITNYFGIRFNHIHTDSFNIQMAGQNILTNHDSYANIWQFPIGIVVSKNITTSSGWNIKPKLDFAIIPIAGDKEITQHVSLTGINGVASMKSEIMDNISSLTDIGLEIRKNNYMLELAYLYQYTSNMYNHGIQANINYTF